jgi:regulator of replication initiation timing
MTMPEFLQKAGVILGMAEKSIADPKESESLKLKIQTLEQKAAGLESQLNEANKAKAALATENTELKSALEKSKTDSAAAETDWKAKVEAAEKSAGQKAAEIAASQGVPVGEVPGVSANSGEAENLESIRAQMSSEKDPEKIAQLARKARELRGHSKLF